MCRSSRKLIATFGNAMLLLIFCAVCPIAVGQVTENRQKKSEPMSTTQISSTGLTSEPFCVSPPGIVYYLLGERYCTFDENCTQICHRYKAGMCCSNEPYHCICCEEGQFFMNGRCNYTLRFMVAAQIALGAALLLAISALSFLVWKMCFRNNLAVMQGRNRVRAFCGLPQLPRRGSNTGSLNSIQNYVVQKMRDRPPRYEDAPPQMPPCYNEIVLSSDSHGLTGVFPSTIIYASPLNPTFGFEAAPPYCVTTSFPQEEIGGTTQSNGAASSEEPVHPYNVSMGIPLTRITENEESTPHLINGAGVNKTSTNESASYSLDSYRISRRNQRLYDEACGGFDNPGFVPDVQEQHM